MPPPVDTDAPSRSPLAQLPLVVDCSVNCEAAAPKLAARGVKAVLRYYGRDPAQPGYEHKRLTRREADGIHAAGMAIGLTYQRYNGRIESFTQDEAHLAADYCMSRDIGLNPGDGEAIAHPKGTVIYFGVDTNDFTHDQYKIVAAYFKTIKDRFAEKGAPFVVGVYGSGDSCSLMHEAPAAVDHFWLAGVSTGWNGTKDFYNRPPKPWHLFQNALEVPLAVSVDTNLVNPEANGLFGAFDKTGLIGSLDDASIRRDLRFVRPGEHATFFKTPGGEKIIHVVDRTDADGHHHSEPRDYIEPRRMVSVLHEDQGWSNVEVTFARNNVGSTYAGFVQTGMLVPISQIP